VLPQIVQTSPPLTSLTPPLLSSPRLGEETIMSNSSNRDAHSRTQHSGERILDSSIKRPLDETSTPTTKKACEAAEEFKHQNTQINSPSTCNIPTRSPHRTPSPHRFNLLLVQTNFPEKEIHLYHYQPCNKTLEPPRSKALVRKLRHWHPHEVVPDNEHGKKYYVADSKMPYLPLMMTCKTLFLTFCKIREEQSLCVVDSYPNPRNADDLGLYGPRK
jgi:hypothetical protein